MQVNIYDAKTQLSQLIERAMDGEDIVIAKAGKPMVKLSPIRDRPARVLGAAVGRYHLPDGWELPMNDEQYEEFTNRGQL